MLPEISYNTIAIQIPSLNTTHNFSRMNGYHEEILLQAKEEKNEMDHYNAVKQIVKLCGGDINLKDLSISDIEWIFLKIRQNSVDEIASITILDSEEDKWYPISVNLNDVVIKYPDKVSNVIEVENAVPQTRFILKYPNSELYEKSILKSEDKNNHNIIISKCIEKISVGEQIFSSSTLTEEELLTFVKNLPMSCRNKAVEFIMSSPYLYYESTYKNSKGEEKTFVLSTLEDFFIF